MSENQDELERDLELLRAQVARLTARVYELELLAGRNDPTQFAAPNASLRHPTAPSGVTLPGVTGTPTSAIPPSAATPPLTGAPAPTGKPAASGIFAAATSAGGKAAATSTASGVVLPTFAHVQRPSRGDLEQKIGQYWLNRIGIVALLTGVSYFLKYAFENNWIGPSGRVAIGLLAGSGLLLWSERFRAKGHAPFSYSLKAVGLGTLYLSLWAAFQMYHLVPVEVAFGAMVLVTAATIVLAWTQDAFILAAFALAGGFSTPLLLSTGENHEAELFTYVAILDGAALLLIILKPWLQLAWGSFLGTVLLSGLWAERYYGPHDRTETTVFFLLFAAIFALGPLFSEDNAFDQSRQLASACTLAVINATVFFVELFAMYDSERTVLTWFAILLAAVYLGLAEGFRRVRPERDTLTIRLIHITIAITFLTIAIPLKLEGPWITIGWIVESAALLFIAARTRMRSLAILGLIALFLGIFRLVILSGEQTPQLIFNARFFTYLLAIAVLGALVKYGEPLAETENQRLFFVASKLALSVLVLMAMTLEASDVYDRQVAEWHGPIRGGDGRILGPNFARNSAQWRVMRDFTYSAIWLIYGAALMAAGLWKRSAFLRWQALVLIAFTVGKVFLYDVSALDKGYRIVSFVALGAVLLGVSFIYQRDWLKLARHEDAVES
ncbi:MAG TPA: DUF2339 domain-containing protein [Candidatus Dormibacteraeota bacterium]|nr:DUF2339 domain-containing protein [Candidatus Dormibacteraeota bacterium]